jgi:hypothetical protein
MLEEDIVNAIKAMDFSMEMQINLLEDEGILSNIHIHILQYIHNNRYLSYGRPPISTTSRGQK